MPPILTTASTITCIHAGQVTLVPKQTTVLVGGSPALCMGDVMGAVIAGCAQPPSIASKPCTTVLSTIPGVGVSMTVMVGGKPVHTQPIQGITDGVPPGTIMCASPGQMTVQAS